MKPIRGKMLSPVKSSGKYELSSRCDSISQSFWGQKDGENIDQLNLYMPLMEIYICRITLENKVALSYKTECSHSKSTSKHVPKRNS